MRCGRPDEAREPPTPMQARPFDDDDDPTAHIGAALVVVPHPDDEVIGCGGLLALLAEAGTALTVVLVSDGAQSHPRSRAWPAEARRALRVDEMRRSLEALGLRPSCLRPLRCPDGAVPAAGDEPGFAEAAGALAAELARAAPQLVLAPWRRDPHRDHRAAHALTLAALEAWPSAPPPRLFEYPVWSLEHDDETLQPRPGEVVRHALRIERVLARKQRALAEHRSQLGLVIDDDPHGFTLPASLVARCSEPVEHYYEARPAVPPFAAAAAARSGRSQRP